MQVDEMALLAAFRVNHHSDAEPSSVELARLRAVITAYLAALGEQKPVAWQGRDNPTLPWTFLRKPPGEGAWAETRPLYTHPPATVTDEAVERAAKAIANEIHVGGDFGMTGEDAYSKRSAEFICLARAALEAAGGRG